MTFASTETAGVETERRAVSRGRDSRHANEEEEEEEEERAVGGGGGASQACDALSGEDADGEKSGRTAGSVRSEVRTRRRRGNGEAALAPTEALDVLMGEIAQLQRQIHSR